jgi:hypothetical protein
MARELRAIVDKQVHWCCPLLDQAVQISDDVLAAQATADLDNERFAANANHINGIENFSNQAKRHLRKYNGIPKHHFHLFLKECEWRFNYGPPAKLFVTLKSWIRRSKR